MKYNKLNSKFLLYHHAGNEYALAYSDWGNVENEKVLICVHGLTRNARDFDILASALCEHYRVICLDMPGRGRSDWLADAGDYSFPVYLAAIDAFLAGCKANKLYWLGTSLGGLLGMIVAAGKPSLLQGLILNDVGPEVPRNALGGIGDYLVQSQKFSTFVEAEAYFRLIHAPFGKLTDRQWGGLTQHSLRRDEDGSLTAHYDPKITQAFVDALAGEPAALWDVWKAIVCPTLVIRGAKSDILPMDTGQKMIKSNSNSELVEINNAGHAPALMAEDQIALIEEWLKNK